MIKLIIRLSALTLVLSAAVGIAAAQEPAKGADKKPVVVYSVDGLAGTFSDYNAMIRAADKAGLRTLQVHKLTIVRN